MSPSCFLWITHTKRFLLLHYSFSYNLFLLAVNYPLSVVKSQITVCLSPMFDKLCTRHLYSGYVLLNVSTVFISAMDSLNECIYIYLYIIDIIILMASEKCLKLMLKNEGFIYYMYFMCGCAYIRVVFSNDFFPILNKL